jgi:hypothetical protein
MTCPLRSIWIACAVFVTLIVTLQRAAPCAWAEQGSTILQWSVTRQTFSYNTQPGGAVSRQDHGRRYGRRDVPEPAQAGRWRHRPHARLHPGHIEPWIRRLLQQRRPAPASVEPTSMEKQPRLRFANAAKHRPDAHRKPAGTIPSFGRPGCIYVRTA